MGSTRKSWGRVLLLLRSGVHPAMFLLTKSQYQTETGRTVERGAQVFQIRKVFPPGEVTPDETNKIGYETAMR